MKPFSLFVWLLILCALLANHPVAAQSASNANQTQLQQRDQLGQKAIEVANAGQFKEAIQIFEQVYQIEHAVFGEAHEELLGTLGYLRQIAELDEDYQTVLKYCQRQHRVTEQLYGKSDYRTQDAGRAVADAERDTTRSPEDRTRLQMAAGFNAQGNNLYLAGDRIVAVSNMKQVLGTVQALRGEQHPDYATSLNNLAGLYQSMGEYARAEPLLTQALEIRKAALGERHPDYASSLNNLAVLYQSMGDYARAEPLHTRAKEIQKTVHGEHHPEYASSLNNLAGLYKSMGDYARAEPLYTRAMEIRKAVFGELHPEYASSLNNLAGLYQSIGDYARSEPLFTRAIEIRKVAIGEQHPDYATSLNNLAGLYQSIGDYTRAEPLYTRALEIRKTVLGEQHPNYATSLSHLAVLYESMGDYARAEPLYNQAMEITKAVLGEHHPDYARILSRLAGLYKSIGDYARAEPLHREAVNIMLSNLELAADVQSQRQQLRMGESWRPILDHYLSLAMREPKFQAAAYEALLRWKGSVWQRQQRMRLLIDQPELKPRFTALQGVAAKLSALILNPPDAKQLEAWRRQLDQLTDEREQLERDLSLASVAFRKSKTPVTPEQLRESLPQGTLLLDFLEFRGRKPANQEQQTKLAFEQRLLVHLVSADEDVRAIDLGDVASLDALVQVWRQDLGQSVAAMDAAHQLRQRIWEPLAEHLAGVTTVYVSPDGLLGQFPLAALPGKRPGSYLIEDLSIVMLPIPQGLPEIASTPSPAVESAGDRFCLVGGVDYSQLNAPEIPSTPTGPSMLAARGGQRQAYHPLPGTIAEIDTIASLVRTHRSEIETTILRGGAASEAAFADIAPGNHYLHVATHGFFAPETVQNAMTASIASPNRLLGMTESHAPKIVGQHPDLLSGLVFAGANQEPEAGADDGILTAAEVQSLDLRGVDLAVLSACETGLGKTAGGEGIIGLQRAFQLAGAKTTVTSLWQVDDAATQALMVEFYRNLFDRKLSKLDSLRQAQLWLLHHPDALDGRDLTKRGTVRPVKITTETKAAPDKPIRSLPAYWAAFQLSGDPR